MYGRRYLESYFETIFGSLWNSLQEVSTKYRMTPISLGIIQLKQDCQNVSKHNILMTIMGTKVLAQISHHFGINTY